MARHPWLDPRAFRLPAGPLGVLVVHGLPGSPVEMRPLAEQLAARGYTVHAPLLPGHGTLERDLARVRWTDWTAAVRAAHDELAQSCERVFVAGLSLGSLLTLELATRRELGGVVLYSPPLRIASPLFALSWLYGWIPAAIPQAWTRTGSGDPAIERQLWYYERIPLRAIREVYRLTRHVRGRLPRVSAPALVFISQRDRSLRLESGQIVLDEIASRDKQLITLTRSGHAPPIDEERERVWQLSGEFIDRLARAPR